MKRKKFKLGEAIVFEPVWGDNGNSEYFKSTKKREAHPLKWNEIVYFLSEIPNVQGHCIVIKYSGESIAMVHPEDFRSAREDEL